MATIEPLVEDFLAQERIAVAGVSETQERPANAIYRKLRDAGYRVYAVSPKLETFDRESCYPDLLSLPEPVDGAVMVTSPDVTEALVQQCVEAGVPRVWMHCMFGSTPPGLFRGPAAKTTSVSDAAVQVCEEHGIQVIPGGCPMMFCEPVDGGHKCIRGMLRLFGGLRCA